MGARPSRQLAANAELAGSHWRSYESRERDFAKSTLDHGRPSGFASPPRRVGAGESAGLRETSRYGPVGRVGVLGRFYRIVHADTKVEALAPAHRTASRRRFAPTPPVDAALS